MASLTDLEIFELVEKSRLKLLEEADSEKELEAFVQEYMGYTSPSVDRLVGDWLDLGYLVAKDSSGCGSFSTRNDNGVQEEFKPPHSGVYGLF